MSPQDTLDDDISARDLIILKVRVANPTVPIRKLKEILEETYGIELSHNRINEILHSMADEGIYRETILPDQTLFQHYLFRIAFHYPNFEENWRSCYQYLVDDPHVIIFFNADTQFQWHVIAQFRTDERMERWVHEFFKDHGDLIEQFHNTMLHTVHKFRTDAEIFDDILREDEEGERYLAHKEERDS